MVANAYETRLDLYATNGPDGILRCLFSSTERPMRRLGFVPFIAARINAAML